MKIAAQAKLRRRNILLSKLIPQLIEQPGEIGTIVDITIISVRRSHGVGNAICRRHAAHFDGYLPGLGAVVNFWQNVAVDVDHDESSPKDQSKKTDSELKTL
jgi:hypothetical protein